MPVHNAHPGVLKDSIVWNIEQGRRLSGVDIAEAMLLSNALYQRTVDFFSRYYGC